MTQRTVPSAEELDLTIRYRLSAENSVHKLATSFLEPLIQREFLGGTVALKPFNYKGVEVNYPEIFRKLRDLFRKGNK